jgi:SulP family sulfate permease
MPISPLIGGLSRWGALVIFTMAFWPHRWSARFPGSLTGIFIATATSTLFGWSVPVIGEIPRTLLLDDRLSLDMIPLGELKNFVAPTLTITALGDSLHARRPIDRHFRTSSHGCVAA